MQLTISDERDPKLKRLLGQAAARLETAPNFLRALPDGTLEMACPLPAGYKPAMNPWATATSPTSRGFFFGLPTMSLYLSPPKVNDLCSPLTQGAAQLRFIEKVLGIPVAGRRPDGVPIVGRAAAEERLKQKQATAAKSRGFNWSK